MCKPVTVRVLGAKNLLRHRPSLDQTICSGRFLAGRGGHLAGLRSPARRRQPDHPAGGVRYPGESPEVRGSRAGAGREHVEGDRRGRAGPDEAPAQAEVAPRGDPGWRGLRSAGRSLGKPEKPGALFAGLAGLAPSFRESTVTSALPAAPRAAGRSPVAFGQSPAVAARVGGSVPPGQRLHEVGRRRVDRPGSVAQPHRAFPVRRR